MWALLLGLLPKLGSLLTGINFDSIFNLLGKLANNIRQYWFAWLIAVLLLSNGFTFWEWRHTDAALVRERVAHAADIASFKNAQATANAQAIAERNALEKESKANAAQADANYTTLLAKYHLSLLRYAANPSGTQAPSDNQLPTPQSGNGSGSSTDLPPTITITGSDAEICAIDVARLQSVHDWAVNLPKQVNN